MYVDKNGRWFIIDDLIMVGVSFTAGYLHHGFSKGDWGWEAVKSGGYLAAQGWLALNTGGASAGFWGSVGCSASTIASSYLPSYSIGFWNFGFSLSPNISFGTAGFSVGYNASLFAKYGDHFVTGVGVGAGFTTKAQNEGLNGFHTSFSTFGGLSSKDFSLISSHTKFNYHNDVQNNPFNQTLNQIYFGGTNWGFSYANDQIFPFVNGGTDQGRTAAFELSVGNFSLGAEIGTSEGFGYKVESSGIWGKNKKGTYEIGDVYFSPAYFGFRGSNNIIHRVGWNHPSVQDLFQNGIHKLVGSPYFTTTYDKYSNPYVKSRKRSWFIY
ncbi:MAG: polymorphic toxin type 23 domain-containing protein [Chloroherpetonaceae bacterium]|nr:polymorphic toxin type 23 domain-containing protein [Chloroherpetonaceae bacterium]